MSKCVLKSRPIGVKYPCRDTRSRAWGRFRFLRKTLRRERATQGLKVMKCIKMAVAPLLLAALACPVLAQQQQPTLADIARAARREKPATPSKVYTNDNLPKDAIISVTGTPAPAPAADATADAKPADAKAAAPSSADSKKAEDDWRNQIAKQQAEITQLERELDVLVRENKLRAATFYADAGNRLRDEKKYAEDDRKYQADIADKQKALDDARKKLDDLKEAARKAGMPPSVTG